MISQVFLAWTFLNFLVHCDNTSLKKASTIPDRILPRLFIFCPFLDLYMNYVKSTCIPTREDKENYKDCKKNMEKFRKAEDELSKIMLQKLKMPSWYVCIITSKSKMCNLRTNFSFLFFFKRFYHKLYFNVLTQN